MELQLSLEIKHTTVEVSEVTTLVLVWLVPIPRTQTRTRNIGRKSQQFFLSSEHSLVQNVHNMLL